jgi:hypothetical protein
MSFLGIGRDRPGTRELLHFTPFLVCRLADVFNLEKGEETLGKSRSS